MSLIAITSTVPASAGLTSTDRCKLTNTNGQNVNLGFPRSSILLPSVGNVKVLVAGVDFSNARATETPQQMLTPFELPIIRDFFLTASYDRLNLEFTIIDEVVRLPITDSSISERTVMLETAKALPPKYRLNDYSALLIITTKDSDFTNGTASAGSTVSNSTGQLSNYSVVSGVKPKENRWLSSPWRTIAHEIGHLLGLMDLWNREDSTAWQGQTAAPFSLMNTGAGWDYAADFFAWEKWVLGWIPDSDVKCLEKDSSDFTTGMASLDSKSGVRLIVIPMASNKALAVEFRKKSALDFGITKPGLLIYTVDSSKKNFELPIQLVPSEESIQQPFSESMKDYSRFKKAPISTFDSVEGAGLQIANLGVLEGKDVLISPKSRVEVKKYLNELESQAKLAEEAAKLAAAEKVAMELRLKQEAEAKAAAEQKAQQDAERKAKQSDAAKAAPVKKKTISCVKGKLTKKVTALKPKCPAGYKKK